MFTPKRFIRGPLDRHEVKLWCKEQIQQTAIKPETRTQFDKLTSLDPFASQTLRALAERRVDHKLLSLLFDLKQHPWE